MASKVLLIFSLLAIFLLISSEAAQTSPTSKQINDNEKADTKVGKATFGGFPGVGFGGRGGYPGVGFGGRGGFPGGGFGGRYTGGRGSGVPGGGYCHTGCCTPGFHGCLRCCPRANEHVEIKPNN